MQFWSAQANDCTLPGCTSATVTLPGGTGETITTIDYTYDPLYRLTAADYSTGNSYNYAYDSVGNRLTQESSVHGLSSSVSYNYDIANRLADVDGVPYVYDANGNLLNDGVNTYTYDSANRLTAVSGQQSATYAYNGLGDRLSQDEVNYTLDLNAGLTQVLDDGTNTYTYGLGRISQKGGSAAEYFLGDALGSVRQLVNDVGEVTLTKSYDPYGEVFSSAGSGSSAYAYTGEQQDANGLTYLRARYYNPADGRFLSRDTWGGNNNNPLSHNKWNYGESNPINYTDPTGHLRWKCLTYNWAVATAEDAVPISYTDPLNTYTAAGIAIQCWGTDTPWGDEYSGFGIAQISQKQAETAYGEPIKWIVNGVVQKDENGKPIIRGYGLCDGNYDYRPDNKDWSAEFMRRRIQMVLDKCKFCTERDKFIVAALAQQGPGFTIANIDQLKNDHLFNGQIDWKGWYKILSNKSINEYRKHWRLFYRYAKMLNEDGYYLPENILNDEMIIWLKNQ